MATTTLTQDILAICLLLADGDTDTSLEQIINRAEEYQKIENRHFGISRRDFRNLLRMLVSWELRLKNFSESLDDIKLHDVATSILEYRDVYFNDEGEHWCKGKKTDIDEINYFFGYASPTQENNGPLRHQMKHFFSRWDSVREKNPEVKNFMKNTNITDDVLRRCSRPGDSS